MPSSDLYSAQNQIDLISLSIYKEGWARDRWLSLKNMLEEIDLFESVDGLLSATLLIIDPFNIPDSFPILGGELVNIEFRTPSSKETINLDLRIYHAEAGKFNRGDVSKSQIQRWHLCTEDRWQNAPKTISKAYAGTYDVIAKSLLSELGSKRNLASDGALGVQSFICPFWTPLRACSWLAGRASDMLQMPFVFFETVDGYQFKSLRNLQKAASQRTLLIEPKIIEGKKATAEQMHSTIMEYELLERPDVMKLMRKGGYGGKTHQWDDLTGNAFDVNIFYKDMTPKDGGVMVDKYPMHAPEISKQHDVFLRRRADGSHNTQTQRSMWLSLVDSTVLIAAIPGDNNIRAGMVVELDIPSKATSNMHAVERLTSGRWLVHSLRHVVRRETYRCVLTLTRDSTAREILTES